MCKPRVRWRQREDRELTVVVLVGIARVSLPVSISVQLVRVVLEAVVTGVTHAITISVWLYPALPKRIVVLGTVVLGRG